MTIPDFIKVKIEFFVKAVFPDAQLVAGSHGKVWISDGEGRILGEIQANGTREVRRRKAWISALLEVCKLIEENSNLLNGIDQ